MNAIRFFLGPRGLSAAPVVLAIAAAASSEAQLCAQTMTLLRDLRSGPTGSFPADLFAYQQHLYFVANNGSSGYEVWRSDGSSAGTTLVYDANSGSLHGNPWGFASSAAVLWYQSFVASNTTGLILMDKSGRSVLRPANVLFERRSPAAALPDGRYVFRSVVAPSRSAFVTDGTTFTSLGTAHPQEICAAGNYAYMLIQESSGCCSNVLARSDGSRVEVVARTGNGIDNTFANLVPFGTRIACIERFKSTEGFDVHNLIVQGVPVAQLCSATKADPSLPRAEFGSLTVVGSTIYARVIERSGSRLVAWTPRGFVAFPQVDVGIIAPIGDTKLLFRATDARGAELWVTDGTLAGTTFVADIQSGPSSSLPRNYSTQAAISSRYAIFQADDGVHGNEPWISDGTASGTRMIKDLEPGAAGSSLASNVVFAGGQAFAAFSTTATGPELYAIDFGASSEYIPGGCGRATDPILSASDPALGTTLRFGGQNAPSGIGVLVLGAPVVPGREYLPHCWLVVDPTRPLVTFGVGVLGGSFGLDLAVPNDPSLSGVHLAAQGVFLDATAPEAFRWSNGVSLRLGR